MENKTRLLAWRWMPGLPNFWQVSLVTLFFLMGLALGATSAWSRAIIWDPYSTSASASSMASNGNTYYGPTQIFTMGYGPFPCQSSVTYPGTCGGKAQALASTAHTEAQAVVWVPKEPPGCNRLIVGLSNWSGNFTAPANQPYLFRFYLAGSGPGATSVISGYYIPKGSSTPKVLLGPFSNLHRSYNIREYVIPPFSNTESFCTLGFTSSASAHEEAGEREALIKVSAIVYELTGEVEGCAEEASLCPGESSVQIKRCAKGNRFVVRRTRNGQEAFIGACLYGPADNSASGKVDATRYRWVNWGYGIDKLEVFTYDCRTDILQRAGYTSKADYDQDVADGGGEPTFARVDRMQYYDPPPSNPDTFQPWYDSEAKPGTADRRAARPSAEVITGSAYSPFMSVVSLSRSGGEWEYGLAGCTWVGGVIRVGDTLTFTGPGILGGRVQGHAAKAAYGGWQVKDAISGRVVFQATAQAPLAALTDAFMLLGAPDAPAAEVKYQGQGVSLGNGDVLPGPGVSSRGLPWVLLLLE